jgi:hypothetical protein
VEPPDGTWSSIEEQLSGVEQLTSASPPETRRMSSRLGARPLAAAALLSLFVLAIVMVTRQGTRFGEHHWELNLAAYLDLVGTVNAATADLKPNDFPAAPEFSEVTLAQAKAAADFPFISPHSVLGGYALTAVRLYMRDNARAVQLKYQNEQGALCLFEMPATATPSFGSQQSEPDTVGGVQCHSTRLSRCVAYRFVLGETGYVLMMRQHDYELADRLIQEIRVDYEKEVKNK